MAFKIMADGVEVDWSGVDVKVDGALAGAVYVHGEKVWPVEAAAARKLYVCTIDTSTYLSNFYSWSSADGQQTVLSDYPVYTAYGIAVDGGTIYLLNPYDTSDGLVPLSNTLLAIKDGQQAQVPVTVSGYVSDVAAFDGAFYFMETVDGFNHIRQVRDGVQSDVPDAPGGVVSMGTDGEALYVIGGGDAPWKIYRWTPAAGYATYLEYGGRIARFAVTKDATYLFEPTPAGGTQQLKTVEVIQGGVSSTVALSYSGPGVGFTVTVDDAVYYTDTVGIFEVTAAGQGPEPFAGLTGQITGLSAG